MTLHYFSGSYLPSIEANSVHVVRMAQAFAEHENGVHLFAAKGIDELGGIPEYYGLDSQFQTHLTKRPKIRYAGALALARNMVRQSVRVGIPDLLYGRNLFALLLALKHRRPFGFEAHILPASRARLRAEKFLITRENCRAFVVISEGLKQDYLDAWSDTVAADKIHVFHDGADIQNASSSELNLTPKQKLNVAYVGSLFPGKGAEIVVELAEQMPKHQFHIVGGQPHEVQQLEAKATSSNVKFWGHRRHSDLPGLYRQFDVMLAPLQRRVSLRGGKGDISRWTSPLKIFEYMSFAKPIVASDLPVLQEVLEHGHTALLCSPERLEDWIYALRQLEDTKCRQALAANATRRFKNEFTWSERARRIADLLHPDGA